MLVYNYVFDIVLLSMEVFVCVVLKFLNLEYT